MKTSRLLSLLLPLFCLNIVGINTQITGLALGTALALGLGGLGAAVLGGKALGGIKAAATNALLRGGRGNTGGGSYRGYSSSYGGGGGHSSYGRSYGSSSSYSHHRGKRNVGGTPAEVDPEAMIQVLSGMDDADCGKRYLCELASLPGDKLTAEEAANLAIFQVQHVGQPSVGRVLFEEAARLGAATADPAICRIRYQQCQVDRPLMREVVEQLQQPAGQINNFL